MIQKNLNENFITIQKLTKEVMLSIYTTHSVRHFPVGERKPVNAVKRMSDEGIYIGYGMYDKEDGSKLLCYAFFVMIPEKRNILLDYFAVMEEYRNHGIGSLFLRHIKTSVSEFDGIIIESEEPSFAADGIDLAIRKKRIAFYSQNGASFTGILADIFDVRYRVLFLPILKTPDTQTLFEDFDTIYQNMVSKKNYETKINIFYNK